MARKVKAARTAAVASGAARHSRRESLWRPARATRRLASWRVSSACMPRRFSTWKQRLLDGAVDLFEDRRRKQRVEENNQEELFEQIGRLKMEVEWLKKKSAQLA